MIARLKRRIVKWRTRLRIAIGFLTMNSYPKGEGAKFAATCDVCDTTTNLEVSVEMFDIVLATEAYTAPEDEPDLPEPTWVLHDGQTTCPKCIGRLIEDPANDLPGSMLENGGDAGDV